MKAPSSLIGAAAVAALASSLSAVTVVDARPMHAALEPHYARYLQEKDSIQSELDEWMAEFKDQAEENGWLPVSEARSSDEAEEDQRQRFFMTKERIKELEAANPEATFSTKSPFTLLTDDEFHAYVHEAYRKADADRRLRGGNGWWDETDEDATSWNRAANRGGGSDDNNDASSQSNGRRHRPHSWKRDNSQAPTAGASDDNVGYEFDFSSLFTWRPTWRPATRAPATAAPADDANDANDADDTDDTDEAPATSAPVRTRAPQATTTRAPQATSTRAPQATTTRAPPATTRAPPAATTRAPPATSKPTTTKPATNKPTSGPVGPVSPDDSEGPASSAVPVASDGDSLDWSTTACVAKPQNQGQCGSCWAFATVGAVEAGQCIKGGKTAMTKYSEQQLTSCDTKNLGCNGGAPAYAFDYVKANGLCTLAEYPYTSANGARGSCSSSCKKTQTGLTGWTSVGKSDAALVKAVQARPVVVAVAAGNNAWKQYAGGVLSTCQTTQLDHAVLAVGYDATSIKIKNSWGERWGEAGYVRLKRATTSTGTCGVHQDMSSPSF